MRHFRFSVAAVGLAAGLAFHPGTAAAQDGPYGKTHQLVLGYPTTLSTLDPAAGGGLRGDLSVIATIYSSLTELDASGKLVGELATDWKQTSETTWVFNLRPDVTFSDGTPFDAETVKWNVERLLAPAKPNWISASVRKIKKVTALSPTQVEFETDGPEIELPRRLVGVFFTKKDFDKDHNPAKEAIGTGPYRLVSYNPDSEVVLEANEKFFGKAPGFKHVKLRVVVDPATRINALKSGELDAAGLITPQDLDQLEQSGNLVVGAKPSTRVQIIRFNTNIKPLDDVRVRQALNYAIDKEAITRSIFKGLVEPATSQIITPLHEGYNKDLQAWPYDPQRAKALLAEAGYPEGFEVEIALGQSSYVGAEQAAQIIVAQLAEVGVNATLGVVPRSALEERARTENAAGLTWFGYADTASIAAETLTYLGSTHFHTIGKIPAGFDEAVAAAKSARTTEEELASVKKATQVAADDALAIFLWPLPQTYAHSKKVKWDVRQDDWTLAYEINPAK